jgi:hypothetical protein
VNVIGIGFILREMVYPISFISLFEESSAMELFWVVLIVVFAVIIGNALLLLRTAKKPRIPDSVKPQPYEDDDE